MQAMNQSHNWQIQLSLDKLHGCAPCSRIYIPEHTKNCTRNSSSCRLYQQMAHPELDTQDYSLWKIVHARAHAEPPIPIWH
jgi:hypothetical protein